MQRLVFEAAWDKTIAPIDREFITKTFHETKDNPKEKIIFTPIRQAINHQGSLLVTVLIQNFTNDSSLLLENIHVIYKENNELIAEHSFSHPHVTITKKTSMPWTFIFPSSSLVQDPALQSGTISIAN